VTVARPIGFDLRDEVQSFVKGVPTQMIDIGQAFAAQADAEFGAEFDRFVQFAAHHGAHVGLTDADDAVVAALGLGSIHVPLLLIQVLDHPVAMLQPAG